MEGLIGLEIHAYLTTKEKLFCKCKAERKKGIKPNTYICPICTGQPGAKPFPPNKEAVKKAVQVALMLNCKINERMPWYRKHYSWPDLPKGYQNTLSGPKAFPVGENGSFYGIKIHEMHLEEDPAAWDPSTGKVDYNRSGFPLIEIVTAPEFTTAEEVTNWLKKLLHNLDYLKAIQSDSGIKADVNVNIPGKTQRVEIKNLNSLENIQLAVEYELERQSKEGSVRETRRFDSIKNKTISMRSKEEQDDYRFISDPDLRPVILDKKFINEQKSLLPESPEEKLNKLVKKFKLDKSNAEVLAKNLDIVEFFEKVSTEVEPKFALHWVTVELLRHLNYNKTKLSAIDLKPEHFMELLKEIKAGKITELQGKEILNKFYPSSFSIKGKKIDAKISSSSDLEKICKIVLEKEQEIVMRYRAGEKKLINFLIGEVMRKTDKRADFKIVKDVLEKLLA